MICFEIGVWGGCKVKGTVSFLKNGIRLSLEPPFFFLRLSGTLINESLKLDVIYVLYADFKTFANFVVSCD